MQVIPSSLESGQTGSPYADFAASPEKFRLIAVRILGPEIGAGEKRGRGKREREEGAREREEGEREGGGTRGREG